MAPSGPQETVVPKGEGRYALDYLDEFRLALGLSAEVGHVNRTVSIVRRFLWQERIQNPSQIQVRPVTHYLADLAQEGRSPGTLANHRSAISRFCEFLELERNPCRQIKLKRKEEILPRYLTRSEICATLRFARKRGIWPEVFVALSTGLRVGELARLEWDDIDFDKRCLVVRRSKSHRPRIVPLTECAIRVLLRHRRKTQAFRWIFPARRGFPGGYKYLDRPRTVGCWIELLQPVQGVVAKFASLPPKTTGRGWHLLRHTFASRAAQAGISIYRISSWLGHSDIRTTRMYAHLQEGYDADIEKVSFS